MPPLILATPLRAALRAAAQPILKLALVFALFVAPIHAADTASYQRALTAGKARLDAGQIEAALGDFQQAVQADGTQYEGFFYLAVASFRLGNHAAALEYGNAAVAAANPQDKPRAEQLVDAIRKAKETDDLARQADEAHGRGLIAKAADLYARAFALSPDRGDIGLKAASLYGTRLNRLLDAAVLFQAVIASGDTVAANAAGTELGALHDRLEQLYREELPRAVERGEFAALSQLSKAFPHEARPRLEAAALLARDGDGDAVARWLGEAVKLGSGFDDVQARSAFLDLWEKDSGTFKSFIADAFGAAAVADMDQRLRSRHAQRAEEQRRAAETVRAEQLAREEKKRQEQLARDEAAREKASRPLRAQLRAPVVAELDRLFRASPVNRVGSRGPAKFFGGYEKNFDEYSVSIELRGDSYLVTFTTVSTHWKRPGESTTETATFTLESFAAMKEVAVNPMWAPSDLSFIRQRSYGPIERLWTMHASFPRSTVTAARSSGTERSSDLFVQFIINAPADGPRMAELFRELQTIDSLSLEQLRQKAGGG